MLKKVNLNLPEKLLLLGGSPEHIAQEMFKLYVLDLVRRKAISAAYGAELMNIHLTDFVKVMDQYEISYFSELPRDPDEVDRLFEQASRAGK